MVRTQTSPNDLLSYQQPKIVYQEIQFHSCYALDEKGTFGNNKIFLLPSADLYLLAVLNSPLMWWHNWRLPSPHERRSLNSGGIHDGKVAIAEPKEKIRKESEAIARRLIDITASNRNVSAELLDWLRVEYAIEKPTQKLANVLEFDAEALIAEVKKIRGRNNPLSVAGLKHLREEHAKTMPRPATGRRSAAA